MVDTSKLPEVERRHLLGKELKPLPAEILKELAGRKAADPRM
jgi:hypothetical protein